METKFKAVVKSAATYRCKEFKNGKQGKYNLHNVEILMDL